MGRRRFGGEVFLSIRFLLLRCDNIEGVTLNSSFKVWRFRDFQCGSADLEVFDGS